MVAEELELWTQKAERLAWNRYMRTRFGIRKLMRIVQELKDVPGEIIELGTYKGGTAIAMAVAAKVCSPEKTVYTFDTFSGMPDVESIDKHKKGEFPVTLQEVIENTKGLDNLILVKGDICEQVPRFPEHPVSLMFMDCDLYRPHLVGLKHFLPLMSEGGMIILEDYFTKDCPGVSLAVAQVLGGVEIHRVYDFPTIKVGEETWNPKLTGLSTYEMPTLTE